MSNKRPLGRHVIGSKPIGKHFAVPPSAKDRLYMKMIQWPENPLSLLTSSPIHQVRAHSVLRCFLSASLLNLPPGRKSLNVSRLL